MNEFEPRIVTFLCNFCSYEGADRSGSSKMESPSNIRVIRTMCSGRVEPEMILEALTKGADGVLVLGCHPGDCHFKEGNYKTLRRDSLLSKMISDFGIEPERVRLDWVSASEGKKYSEVTKEMTETIRALGPLKIG